MATQKLLFEAKERNIWKDKVSEFSALIDQYKVDLYKKIILKVWLLDK